MITLSSGDTFPVGATTVTCSASDAPRAIRVAASFIVTVTDTTAPVVTPPADVTVEASERCRVRWRRSWTPSALDIGRRPAPFAWGGAVITLFSGNVRWVLDDGDVFRELDVAGNTGSASFIVTVRDG